MALKASCPYCKRSFSAPEEYKGKKIDCPSCTRKVLVQTEAEVHAQEAQQEELKRKREEDKDKIALIERQDSRARPRIGHRAGHQAGRPYYEEFQTGAEGVRHFNPRAPSKFQRFRALSDFLVLGAYLELLLVGVGLGLLIYLRLSGWIENLALLFSLIVVWLILGTGLYMLFKYLGELAYLLADIGDQQNDVVQILLDIRESTMDEGERVPEEGP